MMSSKELVRLLALSLVYNVAHCEVLPLAAFLVQPHPGAPALHVDIVGQILAGSDL
jgi:hypothetical protein